MAHFGPNFGGLRFAIRSAQSAHGTPLCVLSVSLPRGAMSVSIAMQYVTGLVRRMKRDRASPELACFPSSPDCAGLGTQHEEPHHRYTSKRQKHCTPLSVEPPGTSAAGLGVRIAPQSSSSMCMCFILQPDAWPRFDRPPQGTAGDANPLFEAEEDNGEDTCQLQLGPQPRALDFPSSTPAPENSVGNDSHFESPGLCTGVACGSPGDPLAAFATPPPHGGLLRALRSQLSNSLVLGALIRLQQRDLHPVGEGLDTIDYTLAGAASWALRGSWPPAPTTPSSCAGMLILCRRAGFGPHELSPQVLLTLLWCVPHLAAERRRCKSAACARVAPACLGAAKKQRCCMQQQVSLSSGPVKRIVGTGCWSRQAPSSALPCGYASAPTCTWSPEPLPWRMRCAGTWKESRPR